MSFQFFFSETPKKDERRGKIESVICMIVLMPRFVLLVPVEPPQLINTPTGHKIRQTFKDLRIYMIMSGPLTTKLKCDDFCESWGQDNRYP